MKFWAGCSDATTLCRKDTKVKEKTADFEMAAVLGWRLKNCVMLV